MKTRKYILALCSLFAVWCLGLPSLASAATIYGTVTDSNGSVDNVKIGLAMCSAGYLGIGCGLINSSAVTENGGMYEYTDLTPMLYRVAVPANWRETPYVYQTKDVEITEAGQSVQVDFQLELAPSIRGSIYQADGKHLVDDTYRVRFQESCVTLEDGPEVTALSGQYSSPVLPTGDYYLVLLTEAGEFIGWRTASEIPSADCADAVSVHVDENQSTGINFILKNQIVLVPIYHMLLRDQEH
ncbi:MAG: carboxypeptidase regulatory-like domain-containing protein [Candidatus Electrothrix sp. AUS4]|nr:carboxypeptidase regulatory-like domain-containing protein [Candidatus Electrothrix sp. AUS4]